MILAASVVAPLAYAQTNERAVEESPGLKQEVEGLNRQIQEKEKRVREMEAAIGD